MSNNQKPASNNERPAHKLRMGLIDVAIWRREGEHGPFYTVAPSRSYKQGEEWKQADNYGADDLLVLAELLRMAWAWIISQPKRQAD
jgi:hypothetical protein